MLNGLYKAEFSTPLGYGYGVVFLQDGQAWGGDSSMYYRGNYSGEGNDLTATLHVDAHSQIPGMSSVFGPSKVSASLKGHASGNTITLTGSSPSAPHLQFKATLTRLPD